MNVAQLPIDPSAAVAELMPELAQRDDTAPILEALDCLRVAVTLYDASERLTYVNRHFRYIFRALPPQAALLGRSYRELVRLELENGEIDPASYAHGMDSFIAQRHTQLAASDFAPRDIKLADGRIIEVKFRTIASGGWIALWSDATQARHAYGRLESAIDMSADAFAFWDADDRLVMCNAGFAQLHGSADPAGLAGTQFMHMLEDVLARGLVRLDEPRDAWLMRRLKAHRARAGATTVVMANGDAYLVRERPTPDGGRATIYTDITDRTRVEAAFADQTEALKATRDALDEQKTYLAALTQKLDAAERGADNAKTTFLRTMGHELKTPLNAIIGFSDLLKSSPDRFSGPQVGEYAGLIHAAGGNLLTMLNQILDLTKIAAGRFAMRRAAVAVRGVVDGALDAVAEKAEDKSIALSLGEMSDDAMVDGDENALSMMVGQLIANAVTFTQNGGHVQVSALRRGARVVIRVEDDGPGVAREDLPRLTEPFEQLVRDMTSHNGGAGLGLTLVKALAELHGGSIRFESARGEGFTAILELPAA